MNMNREVTAQRCAVLTLELLGAEWRISLSAIFIFQEEARYPMNKRLGRLRSRSACGKIILSEIELQLPLPLSEI